MKNLLLFIFVPFLSFTQKENPEKTDPNRGKFYFYWGWNRDCYTRSDITFTGVDYQFTLENVLARDRQSPFEIEVYLNPGKITIPQYNARIGYYLNDKYEVSVGVDHMKYVLQNYHASTITGTIANSGTKYDGVYDHTPTNLPPDFILFEHTDGLNYLNSEFRRLQTLYQKGKFTTNFQAGLGAGIVMPRTNTTLLGNPRYDQFHLSGFGISSVVAINIEFWSRFFLQTEFKAGFIGLPSVRTTMFQEDKAKQYFGFLQSNIVLGANFNTKRR